MTSKRTDLNKSLQRLKKKKKFSFIYCSFLSIFLHPSSPISTGFKLLQYLGLTTQAPAIMQSRPCLLTSPPGPMGVGGLYVGRRLPGAGELTSLLLSGYAFWRALTIRSSSFKSLTICSSAIFYF